MKVHRPSSIQSVQKNSGPSFVLHAREREREPCKSSLLNSSSLSHGYCYTYRKFSNSKWKKKKLQVCEMSRLFSFTQVVISVLQGLSLAPAKILRDGAVFSNDPGMQRNSFQWQPMSWVFLEGKSGRPLLDRTFERQTLFSKNGKLNNWKDICCWVVNQYT